MIKVFFVFFAAALVSASIGFDASSGPFKTNSMSCLKNNGYSFAIFRGYRSYGVVDPNAVKNINAAHAGGINDVGAYIFPCVKCGNPAKQIVDMVNGLKGASYSWIWIDIEQLNWSSNKATNRKFVQGMMDEAPKHGKSVGIYTNSNGWNTIVGNDWTNGSKFPLWWAYWDRKAIMNFKPFAGWKTAKIKQFDNDKTICDVGLDKNFKP